MGRIWTPRVRETSTTTSTGTLDLDGAFSAKFRAFVAAVGDGALVEYAIEHDTLDEWEDGIGTVTSASPDTLSRDEVVASSNSGNLVNFSAGTKHVRLSLLGNSLHEPHMACCRLTASSGVPVSDDVAGSANLYVTPYRGDVISCLVNGRWKPFQFEESDLTVDVSALTTDKLYDLFAYPSGSVLVPDATVWTNDTTRATGLTMVNGRLVKAGATERTYLGTFGTFTSSGVKCQDNVAARHIWNYYWPKRRKLLVQETTNSWTYSSTTPGPLNASTANRVSVVVGVAESLVELTIFVAADNNSANSACGIGYDSTSVNSADAKVGIFQATAHCQAVLSHAPAAGKHYYQALEVAGAGTCTYYGDGGSNYILSGMTGSIQA